MAQSRDDARQRATQLPRQTIVTYALPVVGVGYMFGIVILYLLKFSTDVLLIAPGTMGLIFGISRLWDAVADPIAGYWSDRTTLRLGRRRPWFIASVIPIGLAFAAMWSPPASLHGTALVAWMALSVILFYTATTLFNVPHTSLGAELTTNYHERTRVFAARVIAENVGLFLAISGVFLLERAANPPTVANSLALIAAATTATLILWSTARLRERPEYQGRGGTNPYAAFADVWRNPHARLLLGVFFIQELGFASLGTLLPYVSQYLLNTPGYTAYYFIACMIPSTLSIPLWLPLSRRVGKKGLWMFATMLMALAFGGVFFVGEGDWVAITILVVLVGTAYGGGKMIAPSMQADVIDYDEERTGQRKEGTYFAAWGLAFKAASGFSIILTGAVLQYAGFQPNVEQSDTTKLALRILIAVVPAVLYTVSTIMLSRFRLNEREHAAIRAALARGSAVQEVS